MKENGGRLAPLVEREWGREPVSQRSINVCLGIYLNSVDSRVGLVQAGTAQDHLSQETNHTAPRESVVSWLLMKTSSLVIA